MTQVVPCRLYSPVPLLLTLVFSALEWLYLLGRRGYRVEFCWVPGHVSVAGNERADDLAREAATRAVMPSPVPSTDIYSVVRTAVLAL